MLKEFAVPMVSCMILFVLSLGYDVYLFLHHVGDLEQYSFVVPVVSLIGFLGFTVLQCRYNREIAADEKRVGLH